MPLNKGFLGFEGQECRYTFNGELAEPSIFNGSMDLGERFYDARLGRMFSTDPLEAEYPWQSPYVYCWNNPIWKVDYKGMGEGEGTVAAGQGPTQFLKNNGYKANSKKEWLSLLDKLAAANPDKFKGYDENSSDENKWKYWNALAANNQKWGAGMKFKLPVTYKLADNKLEQSAKISAEEDPSIFYAGKENRTQTNVQAATLAVGIVLADDEVPVIGWADDLIIPAIYITAWVLDNKKGEYIYYVPPPITLPGFPNAERVRRKNERARWVDKEDKSILEWDSKKGEVEKYDKTGKKHKGGFDPNNGKQRSPAKPGRKTNPE